MYLPSTVCSTFACSETDPDPELLQDESAWLGNGSVHSRSLVWIALGMIIFELGVDEQDALARLRSYDYRNSTTVDDIARQMTSRRLPVEALAL